MILPKKDNRKKYFFFLLMVFVCIHTNAQKRSDNDSLYLIALKMYNVQIDSFYKKYSHSNRYDTIYLNQTKLMDNAPQMIDGRKVVLINKSNYKKLFRANCNHLVNVELSPIEINGAELSIQLTPYITELQKHNSII